MIYLDTSALAKLVVRESETAKLTTWLQDHDDKAWATSIVGHVELGRLAARHGVPAQAVQLLDGVDTIPLDSRVAAIAAAAGPATLRTLDAIHLASAMLVRAELTALVAYDHRLLAAVQTVGLPTCSPGFATSPGR